MAPRLRGDDGERSAIGLPARNLFVEPLFGNDNARFEAKKFNWLGSMSTDVALCFSWHNSGVATIQDAMKREVLVGSTGVSSGSYMFPQLLNAMLGTRFKPVLGYPDSAGIGIAMERGEVAAYCSFTWASIKSARPKWVEDKQINMLLQLTIRKHAELPNVPLVMDFAPDEAARQAFSLVFADQEMGRPVVAPPGVPADRLAALRDAFEATMKDQDFRVEAGRTGIEISPIDARAVEQVIDEIYATPKSVIEKVKAIFAGGTAK
jgi:hypothetical protein